MPDPITVYTLWDGTVGVETVSTTHAERWDGRVTAETRRVVE